MSSNYNLSEVSDKIQSYYEGSKGKLQASKGALELKGLRVIVDKIDNKNEKAREVKKKGGFLVKSAEKAKPVNSSSVSFSNVVCIRDALVLAVY